MIIDELFQAAPNRFSDPRLQFWDDWLACPGVSAALDVDWPPYVVGQTRPEMEIRLSGDEKGHGPLPPPTPTDWDDELNAVLISRQVRATDPPQEATRFSLALRKAFGRAVREFGDGYFNSIFFAVLRENGFADHPDLTSLVRSLDSIHNLESENATERYQVCHSMIKSAIQAKAHDLTKNLEYPLPEAKEILVAALVDYIDRRFSVSIRRQRGLL